MTTTTATLRRPAAALVVLLVSLLAALVTPMTAHAAVDGSAESQFVAAINQERAARGLPALQVAGDLTSVARSHSARMASSGNLHHNPNLGSHVGNWQKVGENVGVGPSVSSIHSAFMNSASHRANILGSDWVQVGVGVEVRGDSIWVTEVFRLPMGSSQPAPEPDPEPEAEPEPAATQQPETKPVTAAASGATDATASTDETTDAATSAPEGPTTAEPLPAVAPEADRALAMMTRVAAEDADLDALTD